MIARPSCPCIPSPARRLIPQIISGSQPRTRVGQDCQYLQFTQRPNKALLPTVGAVTVFLFLIVIFAPACGRAF